jgi:transposase-like protein
VKEPAEQVVREIRRATRRQFSAEEKIRIVLSGLRGEDSIAELCRREGIVQNLYYRINNLTPVDVYCGRGPTILAERQRIKRQTIANRRLQHRLQAA